MTITAGPMSWADGCTITGSITIDSDGCRPLLDAIAEAEWQAELRRELSPMFGWIPMPVAGHRWGAARSQQLADELHLLERHPNHVEYCTRLGQEWAADVLRRDGQRTPAAWAEYREHEARLREPNQAVLGSTPCQLRQLLLDNPSWPMKGSVTCHSRGADGQADRS